MVTTKVTTSATATTTSTTTTTTTDNTPGDTRGGINDFTTRLAITMDGQLVSEVDLASTSEHEAGHSGGLNHPWKLSMIEKNAMPKLDQLNTATGDVKTIKDNVMNSDENNNAKFRSNSGAVLLLGQLFSIWKTVLKDALYERSELQKPKGPNNN